MKRTAGALRQKAFSLGLALVIVDNQVMTLAMHEFIRRFLMHVLPAGFHRIRYKHQSVAAWSSLSGSTAVQPRAHPQ